MYVTYSPESGDVQRWVFDGKVRQSKAEMIEKRYGGTFEQWRSAVQAGDSKARRVLLWHLMSQDHPTLRYEDVPDFYVDELVVEFTADELRTIRENVAKASLAADEKETMLAMLDGQIAEAVERDEQRGGAAEGKVLSKSGGKSTPS